MLSWKGIQNTAGGSRRTGAFGCTGSSGICRLQRRAKAVQGNGPAAVCSSGLDREAGRMADGSVPQHGGNTVSEKQCLGFSDAKNAERAADGGDRRRGSLSDEQFPADVKAGNWMQCMFAASFGIYRALSSGDGCMEGQNGEIHVL